MITLLLSTHCSLLTPDYDLRREGDVLERVVPNPNPKPKPKPKPNPNPSRPAWGRRRT